MQQLVRRDFPWLHRELECGDFYRHIVESTAQGIWVIDAHAHIAFVNEPMALMLGHTLAEQLGQPFFAFMDKESRALSEPRFGRLKQGAREQQELRLRHKQGHDVWVLLTTSTLHDDKGQYAGALAIANDITERKLGAPAARVHGYASEEEELEKRVEARTSELRELNRKLEHMAAHDSLTGLLNRRALDDRLRQELAAAKRYGLALSVLMIDVDHFKHINDTAGHGAGDRALQNVARQLAATVRESDVLARFGGEEFVVIAPHTPCSGARVLAERLRSAVARGAHTDVAAGCTLSVSIGVAALDATTAGPDDLLQAADAAMYAAKQTGRNRVCG